MQHDDSWGEGKHCFLLSLFEHLFQEFTWYPKELQPTFQKLRAPWTYMTKAEKKKGPFLRPKRWFPKKEYLKVKKQWVFGLTTSNGKSIQFLVSKPRSAEQWAADVKKKLVPFLKRAFPNLDSYHILLDGEKSLHAHYAKVALRNGGVTLENAWPSYSPDLNPQEHVWAWAEKELRRMETGRDSFATWQKKVLKAVSKYPAKAKLVGSMARRIKELLKRSGGALDD